MAPKTKQAPSFDDIIQTGKYFSTFSLGSIDSLRLERLRRKNEALASEILGKQSKARRASNPPPIRKPPSGPSFASRAGISKKPTPNVFRSSQNSRFQNGSSKLRDHNLFRSRSMGRLSKRDLLVNAVSDSENPFSNYNVPSGPRSNQVGMNIKGIAASYVVVAQNFAPGTTAADIESAMGSLGGEIISCRVITSNPTVIAEIQFADKSGAETIITTFNNQLADGRKLHLYLKPGPPTPIAPTRSDDLGDTMDTDVDNVQPQSAYDGQREQADRERRRAEPDIQDGRYGFGDRTDRRDNWRDSRRDDRNYTPRARDYGSRRLYSDDVMTQDQRRY
ncbi:MAG: hypothetical protein M1834_006662 [Cirrosporium novae-zelandiae]|nr:MAG: hypothetical protein M1834_006662 [Cirrosporium novae-zelandiae]